MNRSGDAACRRSCLQQPETLVRGLGPHRQDRLRILHPITYVIAILCFHGAARDWRQADTMQAEGGRGRTADGAPAAATPGETLEGAVSARTRRGGGRARYTAAAGSPRGEFWRCPPSRAGSSPVGSPRYAAAAKAAVRAAFFIGVFPAREPVRVRPAAPSKEISMRAI